MMFNWQNAINLKKDIGNNIYQIACMFAGKLPLNYMQLISKFRRMF